MTGNRQAFSTDEFRARVSRVHKEMEKAGIDLLLIHSPENIYYLTGYQTSGYFAYQVAVLARDRDPELLVRFLERGNVGEYSWLDRAATWKEGDDLVAETLRLVKSTGRHKTIGFEKRSWFLTPAIAEALAAGLADARIVDSSRLVERVRIIKSEAEVSCLRRAGEISEIEQRAAGRGGRVSRRHHGGVRVYRPAASYHVGLPLRRMPCELDSEADRTRRAGDARALWLRRALSRDADAHHFDGTGQ
jgi:Xaa-Pro dipeptidase